MTRTLQQLEPYLQGHWKLDTDFKDHSQNSNDGTPTAIEWKPTRRGLKPSFDGSSSFVNCGNHESLDITDKITLSSWVKINKFGATEYKGIIDKLVYISKWNGYGLSISTTKFSIILGNNANNIDLLSVLTPSVNTWYHVVATYDGTTLYLYINGIENNSVSSSNILGTSIASVHIGRQSTNVDRRFDGIIGDTRIYNTTLTADEVLNLYNSTKHRPCIIPAERSYTHQLGIKPEDGLVLGFDGHTKNADGTFQDLSGNSNHGTNVGTSRDVGYFGEVRSFDGVDDYVSITDDITLNITDEIAVEALVYKSVNSNYGHILNKRSATEGYYLMNDALATQKMIFTVKIGNVSKTAHTNTSTFLNTWNHLIGVYNGSRVMIYLNGILQPTGTDIIGSIDTTTNDFTIGMNSLITNPFNGIIVNSNIYNRALTLSEIKSKFNSITTLPLFHVDFTDYPDNEDVSYTDNEPVPYSTMQVGSNGTFKIDDDQLTCTENTSTLTLRNNHEFDGSEYITIDIGGTKYSGSGTITQGTVTVSITQGSRFITVAMSDTDVLNSIDIQFRAEVS